MNQETGNPVPHQDSNTFGEPQIRQPNPQDLNTFSEPRIRSEPEIWQPSPQQDINTFSKPRNLQNHLDLPRYVRPIYWKLFRSTKQNVNSRQLLDFTRRIEQDGITLLSKDIDETLKSVIEISVPTNILSLQRYLEDPNYNIGGVLNEVLREALVSSKKNLDTVIEQARQHTNEIDFQNTLAVLDNATAKYVKDFKIYLSNKLQQLKGVDLDTKTGIDRTGEFQHQITGGRLLWVMIRKYSTDIRLAFYRQLQKEGIMPTTKMLRRDLVEIRWFSGISRKLEAQIWTENSDFLNIYIEELTDIKINLQHEIEKLTKDLEAVLPDSLQFQYEMKQITTHAENSVQKVKEYFHRQYDGLFLKKSNEFHKRTATEEVSTVFRFLWQKKNTVK